jgi:hypothetical protein
MYSGSFIGGDLDPSTALGVTAYIPKTPGCTALIEFFLQYFCQPAVNPSKLKA